MALSNSAGQMVVALTSLALITMSSDVMAFDVKINSFGSLVGGELMSGDANANTGNVQGPLFIADYGNGFVYTKKQPLVRPETRLGLQATLNIAPDLSAVVQGVARAGSSRVNLEWAYLSYDINSKFTVQAGRKRIPIFYYSEFQDVGVAYQWIRPPGELYGWEVTNYDGGMLRYHDDFKGISVNSSIFGGASFSQNNPNFKLWSPYNYTVEWRDIRGIDADLSYDWLTTRVVYIRSVNRYNGVDSPTPGWSDYGFNLGYDSRQDIIGWALNTDFGHFFTLGEANLIIHHGSPAAWRSVSYSMGAGYRMGKWSPSINYSNYTESTHATPDIYKPWRYDDIGITLRYDLNGMSDLKLQYNRTRDLASFGPFIGSSQLLSASYDFSI